MRNIFRLVIWLSTMLLLNGCFSQAPSWDILTKKEITENYCNENYKDKSIEVCQIDYLAAKRAVIECKKDSREAYCILMAKYSWNTFKDVVAKDKINKKHTEIYPIMCGWETKPRKLIPCSKL